MTRLDKVVMVVVPVAVVAMLGSIAVLAAKQDAINEAKRAAFNAELEARGCFRTSMGGVFSEPRWHCPADSRGE